MIFLLLATLALALSRPRLALVFQGLAVFAGLLEVGILFFTLASRVAISQEMATAILVTVGIPSLLPPLFSLFLLPSSLKQPAR
ncbi:MAG: hypothetical protein QM758_06960 [Armatimonas sp.]